MTAPALSQAFQRSRKDPIGRLLATAAGAGVRFRFSGATLEVAGASGLHPDDRTLLARYIEDIRQRLALPEPDDDLLELLDVSVEVVAGADRARAVLAALGPGVLGFDVETAARDGNGNGRGWLRITQGGRRALRQGRGSSDDAALDPMRAKVRLAQIYDPSTKVVYVLDMARVPIEVLKALEDRALIAHNSAFELAMLGASGIRLRRAHCSLLMARLAHGAERGGLKLGELAREVLGLEIDKHEQLSDWSADRLAETQLRYAAVDAVLAHRIGERLWADLDEGARRAFRVANRTVPVVAAMRLRGVPFDREIHAQTIAEWEAAYVEARSRFVEITGEEIPAAGPQRSSWLEARMPADMLGWWPRTDSGQLSLQRQHVEKLGAVPEIRPLLELLHADKRLRSFGRKMLEKVSTDGRLRMDLKPAWTKTGRCSCSSPNLQQLTGCAKGRRHSTGARSYYF